MTARERLVTVAGAVTRLELARAAVAGAYHDALQALGPNHDASMALSDANEAVLRAKSRLEIALKRTP